MCGIYHRDVVYFGYPISFHVIYNDSIRVAIQSIGHIHFIKIINKYITYSTILQKKHLYISLFSRIDDFEDPRTVSVTETTEKTALTGTLFTVVLQINSSQFPVDIAADVP